MFVFEFTKGSEGLRDQGIDESGSITRGLSSGAIDTSILRNILLH